MRKFGTLVLALTATLAMSAVLAGAASAAVSPTWFACSKASKEGKTYTGHYGDKACSVEATAGKYELAEGLGKAKGFKGKGAGAVLHVKTWLGDDKVECTKSSESGTPVLPSGEQDVTVSFSKCKALGTKYCTSAGAKKGEVKITGLKGELGYVSESPVQVGLKLESEANPGPEGELAEFECENLTVKITGGLIGVQKDDVNTVSKESEVVYAAAEYIGEHEYEGYKYRPVVNIVGWASEQAEIAKEIEEDENGEIAKIERPILKALICGEYIEALLHVECTPEAYAGLDGTMAVKGEALMVKA